MKDLLLGADGDLAINEAGDVMLTDSVKQAILVRLKWVLNEWRMNTSYGVPYFTEIFVKSPNPVLIKQRFEAEILSVEEVEEVRSISVQIDNETRAAIIRFVAVIKGGSTIEEEVNINV